MSCRAFSRRIGVSPEAVSKAVERGRLKNSVGRDDDGRPYIKDPVLAEREWHENKSKARSLALVVSKPADAAPAPVASQPSPVLTVAATETPPDELPTARREDAEPEQGDLDLRPPTLIDAQTQANLERARKLRLENDVTESRLMPIERVKKEGFEAQRIIRESILNLPVRVAGEIAAETDPARVQLRLEELLHEALNAAADGLMADEALLAVNE
jgi:hypothetical protein